MSNKLEIISYTVFTNGIELYTKKGMVILPSKEYDINKLVDHLSSRLSNNRTCTIDTEDFLIEGLVDIEKHSFGIFSSIKSSFYKVRSLFTNSSGEDQVHEEIIEKDTSVLFVDIGDKVIEIPNGDKIKSHIEHAIKYGNLKGIQNFCKRLDKVINEKGHTIQELLHFLSNCDMPIADDGSIIAYKTLCKGKDKHVGMFVDPYSRNVPQNLGSFVFMDYNLVDPDRRNECSQGLHIARREYLTGYRGDEVFIVKIAPEDVIAVPMYDQSKMRVAGYHIVGKLSSAGRDAIFAGKSIEGIPFDESIISDIIAGRHIGIVHTVKIGGPVGTNLTINGKKIATEPEKVEPKTVEESVKKVEPKKQVSEVKSEKAVKTKKTGKPTKKETAQKLFKQIISTSDLDKKTEMINELINLRKSSKVSWSRLGLFSVSDEDFLKMTTSQQKVVVSKKEDKPVKVNIRDIRKRMINVAPEHKEIVQAYDDNVSYRQMEKQFKRSRKTLQKIISQYRVL